MFDATSSLMACSLTLTGTCAVGCSVLNKPFFSNFNTNTILMIFMPPPVDPAHAPKKLTNKSVKTMNDGHNWYDADVKPEVVIKDIN